METKFLIGSRIRKARERAGLTVDQVAFRCGWKKSRLSNYENGIRAAGVEEVNKISKALEPFLGKYVNFYIIQGVWPSEITTDFSFPSLSLDKAISAFQSVIGDAIDFGRLKLEPGLTPTELVEIYSHEIVDAQKSEVVNDSSRDTQVR